MAGRNHQRHADDTADLRPRRRLTPTDVRLIEERIAARSREIQTLLLDNQRLAASHVALKQDVVAAQQDLHRLSATASSVKAERDAHVREVYERSVKLEAEARSADGRSAELDRVRAEIKDLRAEREQLSEKLKEIQDDLARSHPEQQEFSDLKTDIEALHREIRKGRAAVEYERKMQSTNSELSEVMEKHLISMAREAEKLRSELANAEKRAMAAIAGAGTAANPGPGYAIHQSFLEPGFGGNSLSDHHAVHQVNTPLLCKPLAEGLNYVYGGPHIPYGQYDLQR
ncbi:protein FLC EXPRESSOR-like isoform X2 [Salvia miltiorrhiza]|uniref:protein FLC EXPRESSOR-like isoform X2 n=1 Tax=Salvia miltiorrhiza TaxID=226208 RepID=UPI0025AD72F7|nr:protein FLC EXPRESSOR-like isoform X2 [Salvia miltiorrhiza]